MTKIKIGNAPCSWGVLEFNQVKKKTAHYRQVLHEIKQSGYVGTELGDWGFMPSDPELLKQELEQYNLELVAAFIPINLADFKSYKAGVKSCLEIAGFLAQISENALIVLSDANGNDPLRTHFSGRIKAEHALSKDIFKNFTERTQEIAKVIYNHHGIRSVFHPHCAGFIETPEEIDLFLENTDPKVIGLAFDTGHFCYGGGEIKSLFSKYIDRIWHVHFKDLQPAIHEKALREHWDYFTAVKNGIFCELGQGAINFAYIINELFNYNYDGWIIVEQDILPGMGTPFASAKRNRAYLRKLGL